MKKMYVIKKVVTLSIFVTAFSNFCEAASSVSSLFKKDTATRVHITQGHVKPDPIAFVSPYGESNSDNESGEKFMGIIKKNLCGCGLFKAIDKSSFIQDSRTLAYNEPRMQDWRLIKARFLICGSVSNSKIHIKLYDVNCGLKLMGFTVSVNKQNFRKAAHIASDQIYSRITGESGMFNTQLAYVETMPIKVKKGRKITHLRKLKIMDQDGENDVSLSKGDELVMTPRFSPDGKTIAYLAFKESGSGKYKKTIAHVYLFDIATKRQRPLLTPSVFDAISKANGGAKVNMTYAPRFSPDGRSICFALIIDGKSAIYTMKLSEGKIKRLTKHIAIDTSPAYSRDGKEIVFTSNRSGKEKIYIMDLDGNNVRRITNGEGKYSQPIFSPRGDFIAFSKQVGGDFFIGVVRPNGAEERLITRNYLSESPYWSCNGRYIMFTRQLGPNSKRKICMVDLTGYFLKEINTKTEAYDCAWSPNLN